VKSGRRRGTPLFRKGEATPGSNRAKLRQWWLIALVVGVSMINYPFLQIFNRPVFIGGFTLLSLYFVVGWALSIAVIALYAWVLGRMRGGKGS
jgi:hypothetical protein